MLVMVTFELKFYPILAVAIQCLAGQGKNHQDGLRGKTVHLKVALIKWQCDINMRLW